MTTHQEEYQNVVNKVQDLKREYAAERKALEDKYENKRKAIELTCGYIGHIYVSHGDYYCRCIMCGRVEST